MHPDVGSVTSRVRDGMKAGRESRVISIGNLIVVPSFLRFVCRALLLPPLANESKEKVFEPSWENDVPPVQNKQAITAALESN